MDLSTGYPFWLIRNGLKYDYPFLENDLDTDVLIMGGGISGALIAYKLINENINCSLIDGRSIGLGSTCASTSLLQYEIDIPLYELIKKIGKDKAVAAYKLCSDAIDKIESIAKKTGFADFERRQSLYFAASKNDIDFLKEEFKARKESGFDVQFLNANEIKQKFNFPSAAAILSKQGGEIDVYSFTHALLQYGIKKGLKVFDRTQGLNIKNTKQGISLKTEKGYKITARKLVYATGYETVKYIDEKYLELKSTYAVCSEPMNEKYLERFKGSIFWNTNDPYFYMRLTPDNRILIGGRDENYYDPVKRDKLLSKKTKLLISDFKKLFPGIAFKPEFSWTGTFSATEDGLPFIGKYKKMLNRYFSLGFGGNGITFSMIGAEIIADMLKGKENSRQEIFSFGRV